MYIIVKILTFVVMLIVCGCFFMTIMHLFHKTKDLSERAINDEIKKHGGLSSYKKRMSQLGIMYHVGDYDLSPSWYILVRLFVGLLLAFALFSSGVPFPLPFLGIPLGYFLVDFAFQKINERDNKEFLIDIFNTYANLNIQLKSGLFITDALEYSYKNAKNERFKQALGEMILNFSDKTVSMHEAIEIFHSRFYSPEIDNLCAMLQNLLQYGISDSYANDLINEIKTIISASSAKAEHDIESKAGMIILAFFAVIIFIVVIASVSGMSGIELFL